MFTRLYFLSCEIYQLLEIDEYCSRVTGTSLAQPYFAQVLRWSSLVDFHTQEQDLHVSYNYTVNSFLLLLKSGGSVRAGFFLSSFLTQ